MVCRWFVVVFLMLSATSTRDEDWFSKAQATEFNSDGRAGIKRALVVHDFRAHIIKDVGKRGGLKLAAAGRNGTVRVSLTKCEKVHGLDADDVQKCEAMFRPLQKLLFVSTCQQLKEDSDKEYAKIKKGMVNRGAGAAFMEFLSAVDLKQIEAALFAADSAHEVLSAGPCVRPKFEYPADGEMKELGAFTAKATLAIFAVGLAVDLLFVGATGGAGILAAAQIAGKVATPNFLLGWTHDFAAKLPEFLSFKRLVEKKCWHYYVNENMQTVETVDDFDECEY